MTVKQSRFQDHNNIFKYLDFFLCLFSDGVQQKILFPKRQPPCFTLNRREVDFLFL